MSKHLKVINRRKFCIVAGASAAAAVIACGEDGTFPVGQHLAGNTSDIAEGELALVGDAALVLGRDAGGLYAMATICTHQQCDIRSDGSISNEQLACACHGSRFDAAGNVTRGPASAPLQHYEVSVDVDGNITIDADVKVDPADRTPVA